MCVSEGVEPCSCRVTASFSSSEGSHAFMGRRPARPTESGLLIVWCWHEDWDKCTQTRAHTHGSRDVCFEWFPCSCYVLFRLGGNSFWFHRGGMLAGGPVALMPEHVSGESSPSTKLSWAWTENHHLDAAEKSIKRRLPSSCSALRRGSHRHVLMGFTAAWLGVFFFPGRISTQQIFWH